MQRLLWCLVSLVLIGLSSGQCSCSAETTNKLFRADVVFRPIGNPPLNSIITNGVLIAHDPSFSIPNFESSVTPIDNNNLRIAVQSLISQNAGTPLSVSPITPGFNPNTRDDPLYRMKYGICIEVTPQTPLITLRQSVRSLDSGKSADDYIITADICACGPDNKYKTTFDKVEQTHNGVQLPLESEVLITTDTTKCLFPDTVLTCNPSPNALTATCELRVNGTSDFTDVTAFQFSDNSQNAILSVDLAGVAAAGDDNFITFTAAPNDTVDGTILVSVFYYLSTYRAPVKLGVLFFQCDTTPVGPNDRCITGTTLDGAGVCRCPTEQSCSDGICFTPPPPTPPSIPPTQPSPPSNTQGGVPTEFIVPPTDVSAVPPPPPTFIPPPPPPPAAVSVPVATKSPGDSRGGSNTGAAIGIAVGVAVPVVLIIAGVGAWYYFRGRQQDVAQGQVDMSKGYASNNWLPPGVGRGRFPMTPNTTPIGFNNV